MYLEIIVWIEGLRTIDATFGPFSSKKERDYLEADLREFFKNSRPTILNHEDAPENKVVMSAESGRQLLSMCKILGS